MVRVQQCNNYYEKRKEIILIFKKKFIHKNET